MWFRSIIPDLANGASARILVIAMHPGLATRFEPGFYRDIAPESPAELFPTFRDGDVVMVPVLIGFNILQPEICAHVNNLEASFHEFGYYFDRRPMRNGRKNKIAV